MRMIQVRARSIAGPAEEAVSLADARLWLRQDVPGFSGDTSQDPLLQSIIRAAREHVELEIDKAIGAQTILAAARSFAPFYGWDEAYFWSSTYCQYRMTLPIGPVRSIEEVAYRPVGGGAMLVVDPATYVLDLFDGSLSLAPGYAWPAIQYGASDAVQITYVAGLALPTESESTVERCGEDVIHAIRLLIAHFWFNRSAVTDAGTAPPVELPLGVRALLWPNRSSIGI